MARKYQSRKLSVTDHLVLERNLKLVERFYSLCAKLKVKPKTFVLVYCTDGPYSLMAWMRNPLRDAEKRTKLKLLLDKLTQHFVDRYDFIKKKESRMRKPKTKETPAEKKFKYRVMMNQRTRALKKKLGHVRNLGQVLEFPARKIVRTQLARTNAIKRILRGAANFKDEDLMCELERWAESLEKEKRLYDIEIK